MNFAVILIHTALMSALMLWLMAFTSICNFVNCFPNSTELKGLGPDFVFGFVQAVDGERDPRNLLLAFQIARNIIHRGYDLSEYRFGTTHLAMHSLIVSDCNTNV